MTRYIDVNSFLKYEENRCKNYPPLIGTCSFDNVVLKEELMNFPAADVEPVRHGHWEEDVRYRASPFGIGCLIRYKCSVCGTFVDQETKYCCNCGAKMGEDTKC